MSILGEAKLTEFVELPTMLDCPKNDEVLGAGV